MECGGVNRCQRSTAVGVPKKNCTPIAHQFYNLLLYLVSPGQKQRHDTNSHNSWTLTERSRKLFFFSVSFVMSACGPGCLDHMPGSQGIVFRQPAHDALRPGCKSNAVGTPGWCLTSQPPTSPEIRQVPGSDGRRGTGVCENGEIRAGSRSYAHNCPRGRAACPYSREHVFPAVLPNPAQGCNA